MSCIHKTIRTVPNVLANPFAKGSLSGAKVGDVVHFGTVTFTDYRGGAFSDDIGWRVLVIEGGKALVVSEDVIDLRPYNVTDEDTTWEQCDLRAWLNSDFYRGLPSGMQKQAATTQVANSDNPDYGTPGGNGTQDKVFLLSLDEADKCFSSDSDRQAGIGLITQQTIDSINSEYNVDIESYVKDNGGYYWWLRSPGGSTGDAAVVYNDGGLVSGGNYVANVRIGVRPALWLNL